MADVSVEHDDLTDWLLGRDAVGAWLAPTRFKRLDGNSYGYRADAAVKLDRAKMLIHGVCTSERMDRSREIVRAKGLDVADHRLNPIFTVGHGWKTPDGVIGRCEVNGEYAVRPGTGVENSTPFSAAFFQSGPQKEKAYQAFELVDSGVLRGVSIGFMIQPGGQQRFTAPDGHPALEITRAKMFEVTVLPVGDNPDAVVRVVEKGLGGKKLDASWLAMLTPLMPARKPSVVSGYSREKTMTGLDNSAAPVADQGQQQQQDQQMPADDPIKQPGAKFLADMNTFLTGLLKLCLDARSQHEAPYVLDVIPQIALHLSRAFQANDGAYAAARERFPDLPTLPGAGSALVKESAPNPLTDLENMADAPPADDSNPFAGDEEGAEDQGLLDDEDDDKEPTEKGLAAVAASERRLDAYWADFATILDGTDQLRLKGIVALLGRKDVWGNLPADVKAELKSLTPWLREKAFTVRATPTAPPLLLDADAIASALETRFVNRLKPVEDAIFQTTGREVGAITGS